MIRYLPLVLCLAACGEDLSAPPSDPASVTPDAVAGRPVAPDVFVTPYGAPVSLASFDGFEIIDAWLEGTVQGVYYAGVPDTIRSAYGEGIELIMQRPEGAVMLQVMFEEGLSGDPERGRICAGPYIDAWSYDTTSYAPGVSEGVYSVQSGANVLRGSFSVR